VADQVRRAPLAWLDAVAGQRLGARLGDLVPARWSALHIPGERRPPPPARFAGFGAGSWVVPPTRVPSPELVRIGRDVVIMEESRLVAEGDAHISIGDRVLLARFVTVHAVVGVTIGNAVMSSDGISVCDSWGPRAPLPPAPVVIEDGAYLGAGCIVGPGVRVGHGAFIGEGAVVFDDVPPNTVVYGNPAKVTRRWSADGWVGPNLP
jgi:galactoside O-acetyltransferase